jgi:hypothetical protein
VPAVLRAGSQIMPLVRRLPDILSHASSLSDLARELGAVCLDHGGTFDSMLAGPLTARLLDRLAAHVAAVDPHAWLSLPARHGYMPVVAAAGFEDLLRDADAYGPVAHFAVLRGLCDRALPHLHEQAAGEIALDRGTPVPYVSRPIPDVIAAATPHASTVTRGHLLAPSPFELFPHAAGGPVRVVLDYAHRERLDALTWSTSRHLPRIATIHPALGKDDVTIGTSPTAKTFFDLMPKTFVLADLLVELRAARDKGIDLAVLPELSLPPGSGLETALAAAPAAYPPLIVAGSAHVREVSPASGLAVRANECEIYLDGRPIARHRKIHPYVLKDARGARTEQLTGEQKTLRILAGEHTRLAVVICADLNDTLIPSLLESAWVNLLLVPALTDAPGAFGGVIGKLASICQAVAVVVNASRPPIPTPQGPRQPFHVLAAVPRSKPADQVRDYTAPGTPRAARGTFNPNVAPGRAMTWR